MRIFQKNDFRARSISSSQNDMFAAECRLSLFLKSPCRQEGNLLATRFKSPCRPSRQALSSLRCLAVVVVVVALFRVGCLLVVLRG
jgi:hypothetical protein